MSAPDFVKSNVHIDPSSIVEILLICDLWLPDDMKREMPVTAFTQMNGWKPQPLPVIRYLDASDINGAISSEASTNRGKAYYVQPGQLPVNPATGNAAKFAIVTMINDPSGKVVFLGAKLTPMRKPAPSFPNEAASRCENLVQRLGDSVSVLRRLEDLVSKLSMGSHNSAVTECFTLLASLRAHCTTQDALSYLAEANKALTNLVKPSHERHSWEKSPVLMREAYTESLRMLRNAMPCPKWQTLADEGPVQKIAAIKAYREETGAGLAEAKRAVDEYIEGRDATPAPKTAWQVLADEGPARKVEAIRAYREETGAGLAEAKRAVDEYIEGRDATPAPKTAWQVLADEGPARKVEAIWAYREEAGVGLAEAKHAVDKYIEGRR